MRTHGHCLHILQEGAPEPKELPEPVVAVLSKANLKLEDFEIEISEGDTATNKAEKQAALVKKMEAKLNAKKVAQAMFEKCFKFAEADKDDPFYMAVKPTANEKKVYAKYLAEKLVEGNWKITEDDSEGTQEE